MTLARRWLRLVLAGRRGFAFFAGARGFTFVEVMVVVALFAVVGMVLFSSLSMGLKVWKRAATANLLARKTALGLVKLSVDLRRVYDYEPIGFSGSAEEVAFTNVVADRILNVSYRYAPDEQCLWRKTTSLQEAMGWEEETSARKVMRNLTAFSFGFYSYDNISGQGSFLDSWDYAASGIPAAVKVMAELDDGETFEKVITVPAAR